MSAFVTHCYSCFQRASKNRARQVHMFRMICINNYTICRSIHRPKYLRAITHSGQKENLSEWHDWLTLHHDTESEVWLQIQKAGSRETALQADPLAGSNFENWSNSQKLQAAAWVRQSRQQETRENRINKIVSSARDKKKLF